MPVDLVNPGLDRRIFIVCRSISLASILSHDW